MLDNSTAWDELGKTPDGGVRQNLPLPSVHVENLRLVDNTTPQAIEFSDYLQSIAQKLLPKHDFDAHPIRFVLSDDDSVNASASTHADQTIICFNKGLFKECKNEDEFAYVMGHELRHMRMSVEFGAGVNTKVEEGSADVYPVIWMHEAGYHPEAALDFTARMAKKEKKHMTPDYYWARIADVHPLSENRSDIVAKTLATYGQKVGGFKDRTCRAIPQNILDYALNEKHTSYYARRLKEASFDTLPPLKQMEFLRDELASMPNGYIQRVVELKNCIEKITPDDTRMERDVLNQIITQAKSRPEILALFYPRIVEDLFLLPPKTPAGPYRETAQDIKSFISAENVAQARYYAERILQGHKDLELDAFENMMNTARLAYSIIDWPTFPFPTPKELSTPEAKRKMRREGISLPYVRHLEWAKNGMAEGDMIIGRALYALGALDQNLIEATPFPEIGNQARGNLRGAQQLDLDPKLIQRAPRFSDPPRHLEFCQIEPLTNVISNYTGPDRDFDIVFDRVKYQPCWLPSAYMMRVAERKRDEYILTNKARTNVTKQYPPNVAMLTFLEVSDDELAAELETKYIPENAIYLRAPYVGLTSSLKTSEDDANKKEMNQIAEDDDLALQKAFAVFYDRWEILLMRFNNMLSQDKEKYAPAIRSFFINGSFERLTYGGTQSPLVSSLGKFVLRDEHKIFTGAEKARILQYFSFAASSTRLTGPSENKFPKHKLAWARDALGYEKPEEAFERIEDIDDDILEDLFNAELKRYFKKNTPGSIDIASFILNYPHCLSLINIHEKGLTSSPAGLFIKHAAAQKQWPKNVSDKIAIYKTLDLIQCFPNDQFRRKQASAITSGIKAVKDANEKIKACESLLCGELIKDPDIREVAISNWIAAHKKILGKDDGSPAFKAKTDAVLARLNGHVHISVFQPMLSGLADAIESQRDVSYAFRDRLYKYDRKDMEKAQTDIMGGEAALQILSRSPAEQKIALNFLIKPFGDQNALDLLMDIIENNYKDFTNPDEHDATSESLFTPDGAMIIARRMYENFWKAPMPVRVLITDHLLIPSNKRDYENKEIDDNFRNAFNFVMDELLPSKMKYAKEAKQILGAFSEILPHYSRSLLLSSMLAANERVKDTKGGLSVGERLAIILELMGPAERKFGQAIHSYPATPDDMKADMKRLKGMAAMPTRWQLWERYDDAVPESYQAIKKRLGKVKGAASFMISVETENLDGSRTVMNIQRENALAQAENGFSQLEDLAAKLSDEESDMAHIIAPMIDMIRHARSKAAIETDSEYGAKQVALAHEMYNGTSITMGSQTFTFKSAPWIAYGYEFRDQEMMPGEHFSDFPENTPEEREYKRQAAKAHVTMEFMNILSGGPIDDDRHGFQCRISNNQFGLFDHGALEVDLPTQMEKKMLAASLFRGFQALQEGHMLSDVMYDEINHHKGVSGQLPRYLMQVQRSLLALNDFFHYNDGTATKKATTILTAEDVVDILKAIYAANKVDPVITQTITEMAFSGQIPMQYAFALTSPAKEPITIKQAKTAPFKTPQFFNGTKRPGKLPPPADPSDGAVGDNNLSHMRGYDFNLLENALTIH